MTTDRHHDALSLMALLAVLLFASVAQAQRPRYAVEVLDGGANRVNWLSAINNHDEMVGNTWWIGQNYPRAFYWANGRGVPMGTLPEYPNRIVGYTGTEINDSGDVLGQIDAGSDYVHHFFSWTMSGGIVDTGLGSGFPGYTAGITSDGRWAYSTLIDDWHTRESFIRIDGVSTRLRSANGPHVWVRDLNESLNAVGYCGGIDNRNGGSTPFHATLWRFNEEPLDLGTLGGRDSYASSINDLDEIVGYADTIDDEPHLFLWRDGDMRDIGTFGSISDFPADINNAGVIIGVGEFENNEYRGFIWRGGQFEDLNDLIDSDLGLTIRDVRDINERGTIIGRAERNGDPDIAVVLHPADIWLDDPAPGRAGEANTFEAHRADPGATVALLYSLTRAEYDVPNCPGVTINLANPRLAGIATADANGVARWTVNVAPGAAGRRINVQVVEPMECRTSQRVGVIFD